MTRLALIGGQFFFWELPGAEFAIKHIPIAPGEVLTWDDVTNRYGGIPDVAVYVDRSLPPPLVGLEAFPCLTVFYCIDSHIHSWYPTYAQAFDLCVVSLKDHLPLFAQRLCPAQLLWLPPMAHLLPEVPVVPEADKTYDLLFVGTVDPVTTPGRARFLKAVGERFPGLHVTRGDFRELYPQARLVLNVAEHGDLNFRVFEALACGACLLTPKIGHGQDALFADGEHLFLYPPMDVEALLALVVRLLPDPARRLAVGRRGWEEVAARHSPRHRAQAFAAWLAGQPAAALVASRLAQRHAIRRTYLRLLYLHWAEALPGDPRAAIYLRHAAG